MRHHNLIISFLSLPNPMPPPPSSTTTTPATTKHRHNNHHTSSLFCRHHSPSATATLDLLILILVLFSGTFLLTSYFSYILHSLSLLLPPSPPPFFYLTASFTVVVFLCFGFGFGFRSRKCNNPKCKGLKKALEFDLQLQTEECLKSKMNNNSDNNDVDKLPWKGGSESNPDYECLRAELRKMAPPNGRAVLLFRAKCGCPIAKLVGWGPKKGRKHKKAISNLAVNGDNR